MEVEMTGIKSEPPAEAASNFPKYRRLYSWIMIGAAANYVIHFVGVPVIPTDVMMSSWICDFALCNYLRSNGFNGEAAAFLSLVVTIRIQLFACIAFLAFLTTRRVVGVLFSVRRAAAESWRIYLSALFMTVVCSYYVGADTFSLQWIERRPAWLVLFFVSCMTAVTMVSLLIAVLDLDFTAKLSKPNGSVAQIS